MRSPLVLPSDYSDYDLALEPGAYRDSSRQLAAVSSDDSTLWDSTVSLDSLAADQGEDEAMNDAVHASMSTHRPAISSVNSNNSSASAGQAVNQRASSRAIPRSASAQPRVCVSSHTKSYVGPVTPEQLERFVCQQSQDIQRNPCRFAMLCVLFCALFWFGYLALFGHTLELIQVLAWHGRLHRSDFLCRDGCHDNCAAGGGSRSSPNAFLTVELTFGFRKRL
jgi:hypothetical protein